MRTSRIGSASPVGRGAVEDSEDAGCGVGLWGLSLATLRFAFLAIGRWIRFPFLIRPPSIASFLLFSVCEKIHMPCFVTSNITTHLQELVDHSSPLPPISPH